MPEEDDEPASPPRPSAGSRARAAVASTLSPTTQAAVTMASLLGGGGLPAVRPAVVGRPTKREEDDDPDATIEGLTTRPTRRAPSRPGGRPGAPSPRAALPAMSGFRRLQSCGLRAGERAGLGGRIGCAVSGCWAAAPGRARASRRLLCLIPSRLGCLGNCSVLSALPALPVAATKNLAATT